MTGTTSPRHGADAPELFHRYLCEELQRCARGGYADVVLVRYRVLSTAATLSDAEAREQACLFNLIYSRWRWRTATAQAMARQCAAVQDGARA